MLCMYHYMATVYWRVVRWTSSVFNRYVRENVKYYHVVEFDIAASAVLHAGFLLSILLASFSS